MQKRVVILGGGESGVGAALLANKQGYDVFLSDNKEIASKIKEELDRNAIAYEENGHSESKVLDADICIKSPGIPDTVLLIKKIKEKGISIISEIEFASRYTSAKLIAITGTNGKTTSTLLTYHLLKQGGLDVEVAGNIGHSFARKLTLKDHDYFVLEISSFQLDDIVTFAPDVAVILNITPDHLNRYENDIEKYAAAKLKVATNQPKESTFIFFNEDEILAKALKEVTLKSESVGFGLSEKANGKIFLDEGKLVFDLKNRVEIEENVLPLIGKHNILNTMASVGAALQVGMSEQAIVSGLSTFENAEHRLEFIDEINGVKFINDSKATNVDAVYYALEGVNAEIVWIAGGVDKGNNYDKLKPFVDSRKVKALICLGKSNEPLTAAFGNLIPCEEYTSVTVVAKRALALAKKGMTVLLSPACASFDLFKNYEDRGNQFKAAVKELKKKNTGREQLKPIKERVRV